MTIWEESRIQRFEQPSKLKFTYIPYLAINVTALSPQLSSLVLFISTAHNKFTGSVAMRVAWKQSREGRLYVRYLEALTLQISIPTRNMPAFNGASAIIIIIIIINNKHWVTDIYLLTTIGLTPGGSSTVHIYTQTTQLTTRTTQLHQNNTINNNNNNNNNTVNNLTGKSAGRAPSLRATCPGICLTTEEKTRKNLSQDSRRVSVGTMKTEYT